MVHRGRDLPGTIPLFPLPGVILLPRATLPLHIFEPRYLQMLEDTLKRPDRLIGMIQPHGDGLARVGCAGRVVMFSEMDDGSMDIVLSAISRFALSEVEEGFAPYLRGRVDWTEFAADREQRRPTDPEMNRDAMMGRLGRYMEQRNLSTDWDAARAADDETLINSLSMLLPLTPEDKQALLEAVSLPQRRELLDGLLDFALHGGASDEETVH
ncbi:LON peptidase substrate-binding domain-containing protein [uncultured Paracoccus sp.]|uniref:LON peptidase substrate-binding domain-containing protein n=1 Tax=uncultured Paracoccus sp. TaxID=189685 RepID=UPI002618C488|nr:LON peptidase substrate-binding domain-containing protein [uncultured Paracoccus sp.]